MATKDSSDEWEKLSSHLSSSYSSDEEKDIDNDNDDWFVVKKKKPKRDQDEENNNNGDESDSGASEIYNLYDAEEVDGESLIFMKELLADYLPEMAASDDFSLDYIEQQVFPHLPAKTLLRLRRASARWTKWISNPFFVHIHSLTARSLSGFFFHDHIGIPKFAMFDQESSSLPDPSLSFLPELVLVKASNYGLVCCRGRTTMRYYICNPATAQWALLPAAGNDHGSDTAVAIVMQEPLTYNFDGDYFLVCAYEIFAGVYGFEAFSSEKWEWMNSNEIVAAEKIVPGSGVAVSGAAYWRTTMQRVVVFDPVADLLQEMVCPDGADADGLWEIGELGRKLCVVSVGSFRSMVWIWDNGSCWKEAGQIVLRNSMADEDEGSGVVPLRAQGEREAAVWNGRKRTVTARDIQLGTDRDLDGSEPGYCADFVPYVSSLVHVKSGPQKNANYLSNNVLDCKEKGIKLSEG